MNAADQAELAALLEASGVEVVTPIRRGAAIVGYTPIPWASVLGRLMQFGWSVRERVLSEPEDRTLGRADHETAARFLRIIPREEPAPETHAPEDGAGDHRGVTEVSP